MPGAECLPRDPAIVEPPPGCDEIDFALPVARRAQQRAVWNRRPLSSGCDFHSPSFQRIHLHPEVLAPQPPRNPVRASFNHTFATSTPPTTHPAQDNNALAIKNEKVVCSRGFAVHPTDVDYINCLTLLAILDIWFTYPDVKHYVANQFVVRLTSAVCSPRSPPTPAAARAS